MLFWCELSKTNASKYVEITQSHNVPFCLAAVWSPSSPLALSGRFSLGRGGRKTSKLEIHTLSASEQFYNNIKDTTKHYFYLNG